jgi:hypothetical protein
MAADREMFSVKARNHRDIHQSPFIEPVPIELLPPDRKSAGHSASGSLRKLVLALWDATDVDENCRATDSEFSLERYCSERSLRVSQHLVICFNPFEQALKVDSAALLKNFDSYWYPSADDLTIIDGENGWAVNVRHDGQIQVGHFDVAQMKKDCPGINF